MDLFDRDRTGRIKFDFNNINVSHYFSQLNDEEYAYFRAWVLRKMEPVARVPRTYNANTRMILLRTTFRRLSTEDLPRKQVDFSLLNLYRFLEVVS